jgi:DNA ligase (NAD+)
MSNTFIESVPKQFRDADEMTKKEAGKEVDRLRDAIAYHNHKYYVENDP